MKLTAYHGLYGSGTLLALSQGKYRLILECGSPFTMAQLADDKSVHFRSKQELSDLQKWNLLPKVPGLFSGKDEGETIVLISHLHLDHMAGMHLILPEIKVYLSEKSYQLNKALNESKVHQRDYSIIKDNETLTFGPFQIKSVFTDHPCYGSVGYLIKVEDQTIYYSGDHRYHGIHRSEAGRRIEELRKENISLLIVDALSDYPNTPVLPSKKVPEGRLKEEDIYHSLETILKDSTSLGIFNLYNHDLSLMRQLKLTADKLNRQIVYEADSARLLEEVLKEKPLILNRYAFDNPRLVSYEMINKNPGGYLIQNSYENSLYLCELETNDADYFHLFGAPFIQDSLDAKRLKSILETLNIHYHSYQSLFNFNHAYLENLLWMIDTINPQTVIPFHYSHPEKLQAYDPKVQLLKENTEYTLERGLLHE